MQTWVRASGLGQQMTLIRQPGYNCMQVNMDNILSRGMLHPDRKVTPAPTAVKYCPSVFRPHSVCIHNSRG